MHSIWKCCVFMVGGLLLFSSAALPLARACSGGMTSTLDKLIDGADVVVKGRIEAIDDAHQNGILHVEHYLVGEPGPERIVLSLNEAWRVLGLLESRHFNGGGCFYFADNLYLDDTIIIFLTRNIDGSYRLAPRHFTNPDFYRFNPPETTVSIHIDQTGGRDVTQAELSELIAELSGQNPQPPQTDAPDPLPAPLLLTTTSGIVYLLPVDGSPPVRLSNRELLWQRRKNRAGCSSAGCIAFSPNGVDSAQLTGDVSRAIEFTYSAHAPLAGDAVLFSSTSEALAVWDADRLLIYSLYYPRLGWGSYELPLLNETQLHYIDQGQQWSLAGQAAWSPDGRWLAYSDGEGLWLWDALTPEAKPDLFIPAQGNGLVLARYFSPRGRYLAVTQGDERFTLDMTTGKRFADGVISPDDRILLALEGDTQDGAELTIYSLLAGQPGSQVTFLNARQVYWKNRLAFLVVNCESADVTTCGVYEASASVPGRFTLVGEGYAFDYEPVSEMLVVLKVPSILSINGQERDLSRWVEGEIRSIEWLPSLFYVAQ